MIELTQYVLIREIASLAVRDGHSKNRAFGGPVRERRIRNFNPKRHQIADEAQRAIAHERAREKTSLTQNLETVARAEHELARPRAAGHRLHNWRESGDRTATQVIAVGKAARQNDRIVIPQRSFFVPDIVSLQAFNAVNARNTILIAIGTRKLDNRKFHLALVSHASGALFLVIIINYKRSVDHPRNPSEQRQENAEKKTGDAAGHQHRQRWQHYAEKIS